MSLDYHQLRVRTRNSVWNTQNPDDIWEAVVEADQALRRIGVPDETRYSIWSDVYRDTQLQLQIGAVPAKTSVFQAVQDAIPRLNDLDQASQAGGTLSDGDDSLASGGSR